VIEKARLGARSRLENNSNLDWSTGAANNARTSVNEKKTATPSKVVNHKVPTFS